MGETKPPKTWGFAKHKQIVMSIFDCYALMRGEGFDPGTRYIIINKKNLKIVADFIANDTDDLDPGEVLYAYQKQRTEG